jgi:hypothetical protein
LWPTSNSAVHRALRKRLLPAWFKIRSKALPQANRYARHDGDFDLPGKTLMIFQLLHFDSVVL